MMPVVVSKFVLKRKERQLDPIAAIQHTEIPYPRSFRVTRSGVTTSIKKLSASTYETYDDN